MQLVRTCRNCRFGKHLSSDKNFVTLDVPFSSCKHYTHTNSCCAEFYVDSTLQLQLGILTKTNFRIQSRERDLHYQDFVAKAKDFHAVLKDMPSTITNIHGYNTTRLDPDRILIAVMWWTSYSIFKLQLINNNNYKHIHVAFLLQCIQLSCLSDMLTPLFLF